MNKKVFVTEKDTGARATRPLGFSFGGKVYYLDNLPDNLKVEAEGEDDKLPLELLVKDTQDAYTISMAAIVDCLLYDNTFFDKDFPRILKRARDNNVLVNNNGDLVSKREV